MPLHFAGTFTQKVDVKGRFSVPAKMRRVIESGDDEFDTDSGSNMYIVYGIHLEGYVEGYTAQGFADLVQRIVDMDEDDEGTRDRYQRKIISKSVPVVVDKAGRAVLPKEIRDKLGIGEAGMDLTFSGLGDRFEIRQAEQHAIEEEDDRAWLESKGPKFRLRSKLKKS